MKEFDVLYRPYRDELTAFGGHWCGPSVYESWKETLIAKYDSDEDSDGQPVEVYCTAAPARFYRIVALAGANSVGTPLAPFEISTGSGAGELAARIAEAISQGMLTFDATQQSPSA